MSLRNDIETIASDAAARVIPILNDELKEALTDGDWPAELSGKITIDYSNGTLYLDYPPEIEEQIHDLEYGSIGTPPRPVLRSFLYRSSKAFKYVLENDTVDLLLRLEQVF